MKSQNKFIALIALFTLYTLLCSHEFWLHPEKYIYARGEKINVRFFVGENFEGENWHGNNQRIQSLKLYYGGVSDDLSKLISGEEGDSLELTILDEGTNLIAFHSKNTYIEIDGEKFNDYLKEDGLQNAIEYRKQSNETDSMGREYYQRCAKTLIQSGNVKDKTYNITTGMPIDIIPSSNPYQLKDNDSLRVKILFQKAPLANTLIKTWHHVNGLTEKKEWWSNENGEIVIPVITKGRWMISTVKMERVLSDQKAQWQSYWGSLTWGYE
jgi:uncharacterized GH25 family protein